MSRFYRDKLGAEQLRIFQRLVNGENIFLTGNAGTGKSFLVEAFNEYCEENNVKLLKAAPTGVAACNIKGTTLHKLFGLKTDVRSMLKEDKSLPERVEKTLNLASAILIDEISMVRIDVFDKIMRMIELVNEKRRQQKRKDIQLIFVGDFYQLAPVIPAEEKDVLDLYYGTDIGNGFAFQSRYWQSLCVQMEKLTEVRRQDGDKLFCTALDQCKEGDTDCLPFFATSTAKKENSKAIWVCGKNATALEKNLSKLKKVKGKEQKFFAQYEGNAVEKDRLCDDTFVAKIGARVLMLVNDASGLFQNGSMGTIKKIEDGGIWVDIDKKDDNGNDAPPLPVYILKHDFSKYEYQTCEITDDVEDERGERHKQTHTELLLKEVGKAIQYPMKLGFAVTVHKAQGQTYDAMNFEPEIFQDGQLYVALSRCRFANTLYINSPLAPKMVRASQEVVNYYKNPENYSFFGREKDIVNVQVSRECEGAAKLLNTVYSNHKAEILDFLKALEKTDKADAKEKEIAILTKKKETKDVQPSLPCSEKAFTLEDFLFA